MDAASGVSAANAVLLALRRRGRTGRGELVEVAQSENMLNHIGEYLIDAGRTPRSAEFAPTGNRHPTNAPQGAYPCHGDDQWVVISVDDDEAWRGLGRAMGHPGWATDELYATAEGRRAHHDLIDERIGSWTIRFDPWEITRRCQANGVACGPVLGDRDCFEDPHLRERGFFRPNGSAEVGVHDHPGHLWHWSGPPLRWDETCVFGAANDSVWREVAGLSEAEYEELRAAGHISCEYLSRDGTPM
jgi:crotonobetainyl-CoA:carnitine CoA-transferase CaiB-like acyl-CoA transferase